MISFLLTSQNVLFGLLHLFGFTQFDQYTEVTNVTANLES